MRWASSSVSSSCARIRTARPAARGSSRKTSSSSITRSFATSASSHHVDSGRAGASSGGGGVERIGFDKFSFAGGQGTVPFRSERNFALGIPGFRYADLFDPAQLAALDVRFRADLAAAEPALAWRYEAYRSGTLVLSAPDESELLIAVAR